MEMRIPTANENDISVVITEELQKYILRLLEDV